ncbi:MAG: aminotransferase class V-fold PLP-dependent enzyme, partial [Longimicrobiales bacterium]
RWRADTPAAARGRIHLNNAGAALMPAPVIDVIQSYLGRESEMGGYEAEDAAAGEIAAVYDALAALLGASARNIAVIENATTGFALALAALDPGPGDIIITTRDDYPSNQLMYLSLAARRGVEVVHAPDAPNGGVDPQAVRELVRARRPRAVAVSHVPTHSGLVQPVEALGEICAEAEVPYIVDACQSVGQIAIDAPALRCDVLVASARKFLRGPRGIGFLYASDDALARGLAPLYPDLRAADWTAEDGFTVAEGARRFENWEYPYALVLGMGEAARYATDVGVREAGGFAAEHAVYIRERLAALPGVRLLDRGPVLCAIATATFDGHAPGDIVQRLREQAINTSVTRIDYPMLDASHRAAGSAVRISPHYYVTRRDIDIALMAIEEFAE